MSAARPDAANSTIPDVPQQGVILPQHAGCGPPGPEGAGGPGHPTKDAPAAGRPQLGEAEL